MFYPCMHRGRGGGGEAGEAHDLTLQPVTHETRMSSFCVNLMSINGKDHQITVHLLLIHTISHIERMSLICHSLPTFVLTNDLANIKTVV